MIIRVLIQLRILIHTQTGQHRITNIDKFDKALSMDKIKEY